MRCLNRNNFALALMKYVNFDGFLITGQHSGTHWIKWMMSHAIAHHYGVPPPKYMNNSSSNELIGHPKHPRRYPDLPRIASSHSIPPYALQWKWVRRLRKPPPYAVVVRDVHDLLISNYEKWRESYAVPFSQYVAGDPRGKAYVCDVWWYVRFANRWGDVAQRHPLETLVLRYEDFRKYPLESLQRLCQHFGLELTEDDWDRIHRVNAKGVFFCLQRVAREMIACRGGRIINIASIAGKGYVGASNAAYAASKGAVISMTKLAALQLAKHDITVNSVCPGVTRTALSDANLSVRAQQESVTIEEMERRRAAFVPLNRVNDPEDIAAMVVFLASAGARNITGQSFNVDGGLIPD